MSRHWIFVGPFPKDPKMRFRSNSLFLGLFQGRNMHWTLAPLHQTLGPWFVTQTNNVISIPRVPSTPRDWFPIGSITNQRTGNDVHLILMKEFRHSLRRNTNNRCHVEFWKACSSFYLGRVNILETGQPIGLMCFDIQAFQPEQGTVGHDVADKLLKDIQLFKLNSNLPLKQDSLKSGS